MRALLLGLCLLACAATGWAQPVRLWPGGVAPADAPREQQDTLGGQAVVWDVTEPELLPYLPATRADKPALAAIVLPGGGGRLLGLGQAEIAARALAAQGIPTFVLKHRTLRLGLTPEQLKAQLQENPRSPPAAPGQPRIGFDEIQREVSEPRPWRQLQVADTQQALRLLRADAARWGLDPRRLVLVGQSNGSVVTAEALEAIDASDPGAMPHAAAFLYGAPPRAVRVVKLPIYAAVAADDALTVEGTLRLALDWRKAGQPAELHVYAAGGHGFRVPGSSAARSWVQDLVNWMVSLPPPP